jgi:hypothetical protein
MACDWRGVPGPLIFTVINREGLEEGQRRYGAKNAGEKCAACGHGHDGDVCDDCECRVFSKARANDSSELGYGYPKGTTTSPSQAGGGQKFYEPTRDRGEYAMCACGHEKAMHKGPGGACYGCLCKGITNAH